MPINPCLIYIISICLIILEQAAIDIYVPSMPAMADYFHSDAAAIQLTITYFYTGLMFSRIIFGSLSDHYGRRITLLISNGIFLLAGFGICMCKSIHWILLLRFIQGIGAGGIGVICLVLVKDVYHGKEFNRRTSYLAVAWSVAPIAAPVLGGYVQHFFNWQINFVLISFFSLLIQILCFYKLAETKNRNHALPFDLKNMINTYWRLLQHPHFMKYATQLLIISTVFVPFTTLGPFLLQNQLHYSAVIFGWSSVITAGGFMLGSYSNGKIIFLVNVKKLMLNASFFALVVSLAMMIIAYLGFFNWWVVVLPISLILFAMGFVYANTVNECMTPLPESAGSANALMGMFAYLGSIIATIITTKMSFATQLPMAIFLLCAAILYFVVEFLFHYFRLGNKST